MLLNTLSAIMIVDFDFVELIVIVAMTVDIDFIESIDRNYNCDC
jgi:hypothetical protein